MNIRYTSGLLICALAGLVAVVSCDPTPDGSSFIAHKDHKMKLSVIASPPELRIDPKSIKKCKAPRGKHGCVVVEHRGTATLSFKLVDSEGWYFDEFQVCEGSTKPVTCGLQQWQRTEFSAYGNKRKNDNFPNAKGVIKLSGLSAKPVKKFSVYDFNNTEQDYFYIIKACPKNGEEKDCVSTDPLIRNKGKL